MEVNPLPRYAQAVMKQSEADFQKTLIDLLHCYGYRVAHFRPAKTDKGWRTPVSADGSGWPDLFVVHPDSGNAFAVECKSDTGKLSPEQENWIEWLRACGIRTFVWMPKMWPEIGEIVKAWQRKEVRYENSNRGSY